MGESSTVHIAKVDPSDLAEYARTPITFAVRKRFELHGPGEGQLGFILLERDLQAPYQKDSDALSGEGPTSWATRFDLSNWVFFAAFVDDRRVGGAAVAFNTPGLFMSEGRGDLAVHSSSCGVTPTHWPCLPREVCKYTQIPAVDVQANSRTCRGQFVRPSELRGVASRVGQTTR